MSLSAFFSDGTREFRQPVEVRPGDEVQVRFRTPAGLAEIPRLILPGSGNFEMTPVEHTAEFSYYRAAFNVEEAPVYYYFSFVYEGVVYFYDRRGAVQAPAQEFYFQVTPGFSVPEWAKGAVMYQIFVDRFCNGNRANNVLDGEYYYLDTPVEQVKNWKSPVARLDVGRFYGGDLEGVQKKLDYLQSLGVEVLYFNPIFVSPSNHKYDSQDYDYVDPHYGVIINDVEKESCTASERYIIRTTDKENLEASNAYFARLVKEIHRRGMKVILDGVFNHCGSFHKWMDREGFYAASGSYEPGAYVSKDSPYRNYFLFHNPEDKNSYEGWWGYSTLPKLNYEASEELCEYICKIGAKWVSEPFCVDGWRLDVAADLGHSEEFNHKFWKRFRKAVKEANPDALILAEHYGNASAWLAGDEWDTIMNYDAFMEPITWFLTGMEKHSDEFRGNLWNNEEYFTNTMKYAMAKFQTQSLHCAMNELSNHDHSRFLTRTNHRVGRVDGLGMQAASEGINRAVFKEAMLIQMTWPGAPTIYYGDEAGLCGFTDPDNRRPYPWGQEDKELLELEKELVRIHKTYPALRDGSFIMLHCEHGIISYGRFDRDDQFLIAVNNNDFGKRLDFTVREMDVRDSTMVSLILVNPDTAYPEARLFRIHDGKITLNMPPNSACIVKNFKEF